MPAHLVHPHRLLEGKQLSLDWLQTDDGGELRRQVERRLIACMPARASSTAASVIDGCLGIPLLLPALPRLDASRRLLDLRREALAPLTMYSLLFTTYYGTTLYLR